LSHDLCRSARPLTPLSALNRGSSALLVQRGLYIRHRTDEVRHAAKRRGVSFGRPQKLRPDQKTLALAVVREGRSISEVAKTFNVHPATIHRCLNAPQAENLAL